MIPHKRQDSSGPHGGRPEQGKGGGDEARRERLEKERRILNPEPETGSDEEPEGAETGKDDADPSSSTDR